MNNELPKNYNFLFVILTLIAIVLSCFTFLIVHNTVFNYKKYITYMDNKIYYPIGYQAKVGATGDENKSIEEKCTYVFNKKTSYELCFLEAKYNSYKTNNYEYLKSTLTDKGYSITEVKESMNGNLVLLKFDGTHKSNYMYLYNYNDTQVIYGYFVKTNVTSQKDIDILEKILSKVEK